MKGCGTYTWFGYTRGFAERLRAIKKAGFDTVSTFWAREMEGIDAPLTSQYEICDSFGLVLEHAHLPYFGIDVMWGDDLKAKAFTDYCVELAGIAGKGSVRTLVMHTCEIESPAPERYPGSEKGLGMSSSHPQKGAEEKRIHTSTRLNIG